MIKALMPSAQTPRAAGWPRRSGRDQQRRRRGRRARRRHAAATLCGRCGGGGHAAAPAPAVPYDQQITNARALVNQDPKRVAQVVRNWVSVDE